MPSFFRFSQLLVVGLICCFCSMLAVVVTADDPPKARANNKKDVLDQHPVKAAFSEQYHFMYLNDPESSAVVKEYDGEGGNDFTKSSAPRIVIFCLPNNGYCRTFKKKYVAVAQQVLEKHPGVEFYAWSCALVPEPCQNLGITSYPALYAFLGEGAEDYSKIESSSLSLENIERTLHLDQQETEPEEEPEEGEASPSDDTPSSKDAPSQDDASQNDETQPDEGEEEGLDVSKARQDDGTDPDDVETNQNDESPTSESDAPEDDTVTETKVERAVEEEVEDVTSSNGDDEAPAPAENGVVGDAGDDENAADKQMDVDHDASGGENSNAASEEPKEEEESTIAPADQGDESEDDEDAATQVPDPKPGFDERRPKPGATTAKSRQRDMDKWKNFIKKDLEKRKGRNQRMRAEPEISHGATDIMKGNQPGTSEYAKRREELAAIIRKRRRGRGRLSVANKVLEHGPIPVKKIITTPILAEKIPVVKRMVKMNAEEELILDASLSFLFELGTVYPDDKPLSYDRKHLLKEWLDLMSVSLPQEWGIHELIKELIMKLEFISQKRRNLELTLKTYRNKIPRQDWSPSCISSIPGGDLPCGFWKLLHVMSVGVAEHRGGLNLVNAKMVPEKTKIFSPMEAADTLRDFMEFFYHCKECSSNFVKHYDNCENNRRCDRLTEFADDASDDDWKELAMWLWEVHNDISVRVLRERSAAREKQLKRSSLMQVGELDLSLAMPDDIQALWPTLKDCATCFNFDGTWNEGAVFLYLEKIYWPGYDLKTTSRHLVWTFDADAPPGSRLTMVLVFVGLYLVYAMRQSLRKPALQRTLLLAKRAGLSPKKRSA